MVERDLSFIHSYSTRNTPTRSFIHTNTFTAEASCTLQTHAGGELRNSQNKRMRLDPYMNSGGRAPADRAVNPQIANGRAKGQRV